MENNSEIGKQYRMRDFYIVDRKHKTHDPEKSRGPVYLDRWYWLRWGLRSDKKPDSLFYRDGYARIEGDTLIMYEGHHGIKYEKPLIGKYDEDLEVLKVAFWFFPSWDKTRYFQIGTLRNSKKIFCNGDEDFKI
ncbi:hypothetical protein ES703_59985 [subsurface metagenome]